MEKINLYVSAFLLWSFFAVNVPAFAGDMTHISEILKKADELRKSNANEAIELLSSEIQSDQFSTDEKGEMYFLQGKIYYYDEGDKEKAIGHYYNALRYFRLSDNRDKEFDCLLMLGLSYKNLAHYDYALQYLNESILIDGLDSTKIRLAQYNSALTWQFKKGYEEAKIILTQLCQYYEAIDVEWYALCLASLADNYSQDEDIEMSLELYGELIEITNRIGNYAGLRSKAINSIGFLKLEQNQFNEAEKFLLEGLSIKSGSANQQSLLISYLNLGLLYRQISDFEKAINYFEQGIKLDQKLINHKYLIEALEELAGIYASMGDLKKELFYKDKILAIHRPLIEASSRLEVLHDRYRAERAKYYYDKIQLQDQLITNQNRSILGGAFLFGLLIIVLIFFVIQNRKLRDQNDLMPSLRMKDKLLNYIKSTYGINLEVAEEALRKKGRQAPD